jgi:hypothetical protein
LSLQEEEVMDGPKPILPWIQSDSFFQIRPSLESWQLSFVVAGRKL